MLERKRILRKPVTTTSISSRAFSGQSVTPGVLQIEALAQVGAILAMREFEDRDAKDPFFAGIERPFSPQRAGTRDAGSERLRSVQSAKDARRRKGDGNVPEARS